MHARAGYAPRGDAGRKNGARQTRRGGAREAHWIERHERVGGERFCVLSQRAARGWRSRSGRARGETRAAFAVVSRVVAVMVIVPQERGVVRGGVCEHARHLRQEPVRSRKHLSFEHDRRVQDAAFDGVLQQLDHRHDDARVPQRHLQPFVRAGREERAQKRLEREPVVFAHRLVRRRRDDWDVDVR